MMKKPSVLSVVGLAASLILAAVLFFPEHGGPAVQAAVIMQKLSEQVAQGPRLDIEFDAVHIDSVQLEGKMQVARTALAGDLSVRMFEGDKDKAIRVDIALGMSPSGGWVLLRRLVLPDSAAQAVLASVLSPNGETLLLFSDPSMFEEAFDLDLDAEIAELHSDGLLPLIQALTDAPEKYGATIETQRDGTILLTLPITDAKVLNALEHLVDSLEGSAMGQSAQPAPTTEKGMQAATEPEENAPSAAHEAHELIGSTFKVVYDPRAELVRSFRVVNLGPLRGSISITLGQGDVDPALLDSSRVTTPNTRVIDFAALKGIIDAFEHTHGKGAESDDE